MVRIFTSPVVKLFFHDWMVGVCVAGVCQPAGRCCVVVVAGFCVLFCFWSVIFDSALCGLRLGFVQVSVEERAVLKGTVEGTAGANAARHAQTQAVSCCWETFCPPRSSTHTSLSSTHHSHSLLLFTLFLSSFSLFLSFSLSVYPHAH